MKLMGFLISQPFQVQRREVESCIKLLHPRDSLS
uniref:Uncharacterized protein n=1 Tax=Nelumbo nucifera TaxID=4432 RepID=A0A822ZJ47_NELNU|nr:TPA_asm: hypothetical protein HUJ06_003392 [Nelumbo nucifera]